MDFILPLVTLLHVLVFVYWLGGDLGAFYASTLLTDVKQPVPARAAAAKVLANIDMAPRTALILAAPTGLLLAAQKGWLDLAPTAQVGVWLLASVWLALAWVIHVRHSPPHAMIRRIDLVIRWLAIAGLAAFALGAFGAPPLFLALKASILAAAIGAGLLIRSVLSPFGEAFTALMRDGATEAANARIARILNRARPIVLVLWALLLSAAFLGLATPT